MAEAALLLATADRFATPAQPQWIRPFIPAGIVGVYMLLAGDEPIYIGRSDTCLRTRLVGHEHLDAASHLVWKTCGSPRHAYHLESYWYDRLQAGSGLLNRVHPARPSGSEEPCPFCEIHNASTDVSDWMPPMNSRTAV